MPNNNTWGGLLSGVGQSIGSIPNGIGRLIGSSGSLFTGAGERISGKNAAIVVQAESGEKREGHKADQEKFKAYAGIYSEREKTFQTELQTSDSMLRQLLDSSLTKLKMDNSAYTQDKIFSLAKAIVCAGIGVVISSTKLEISGENYAPILSVGFILLAFKEVFFYSPPEHIKEHQSAAIQEPVQSLNLFFEKSSSRRAAQREDGSSDGSFMIEEIPDDGRNGDVRLLK